MMKHYLIQHSIYLVESGQKKVKHRYLDILINQQLRSTLVTRSKIIQQFRSFLQERGFIEVETPILATSIGIHLLL